MNRSLLPVLVLLSCSRLAFGADPSPVTRDSIVKAIQAREQALTSFEVHGRQFVSDESGERVPNTYGYEFTYSQTSQGQREMRTIRIAPDGTRRVTEWVRDDGTKLYSMNCMPKFEDVIESVNIQETPNQPSRCVAPINLYTNILMPRGRRLSTLIAGGSSMNVVKGENGGEVVEMNVADGGKSFGIRLSGEHDYMTRELIFSERVRNVSSTFRNVEGFWFPDSGYATMVDSEGKVIRFGFRIDRISVNLPKSPKDYGLPKLNVGTYIHNRTRSGPSGVFGVPGNDDSLGRKAMEELHLKYGSNSDEDDRPNSSASLSIAASPDPERTGVPAFVLISGASLALIAACFLYWRR